MSDIHLCIHGHFYQPPRENPWLGIIEIQPSARPFHDWNQRITRECYAPNAKARILDERSRIRRLVNNYEYMSFNFGPTLLSWMQHAHPEVYADILEADRVSRSHRGGHGNALAQVYNHVIMPLANTRDKLTQIRWGLKDFEFRYGRRAEGMWLAETAADSETLRLLAAEGVKFTILAPHQAARTRPLPENGEEPQDWKDVSGGQIDPRRSYRARPKGAEDQSIDVFFYDGPTSRAVAFERLLTSGGVFLDRLTLAAGNPLETPRLVNLATDGESYGHHFQFGEMALAWLFDRLEENGTMKLTNYGEFLDLFPPIHEVSIVENSSWSCAHGVERWRSDCGCHTGGNPGWNQAWRTPLREGLNWLRDRLIEVFEREGGRLFKDPWAARDDFIDVMLTPTPETKEEFFQRHTTRTLGNEDRIAALKLMGSQVMSLFMFTSCGWFFDDIAGLEPVQCLKYASRAIDLVGTWPSTDLRAGLLGYLDQAKPNDPAYQDGRRVYVDLVEKSRVAPELAAAHFAMRQLVDDTDLKSCAVARTVRPEKWRRLLGPGLIVVAGEANIGSEFTGQEFNRAFLAWSRGGLQLNCLVGETSTPMNLEAFTQDIRPALDDAWPEGVEEVFLRLVPGAERFELDDLIPDSRQILVRALAKGLRQGFGAYVRDFFETHQDVLLVMEDARSEDPDVPGFVYSLVIGEKLAALFDEGLVGQGLNWEAVRDLADRAVRWKVPLGAPELNKKAQVFIQKRLEFLAEKPDAQTIEALISFLGLIRDLNLKVDFWPLENKFARMVFDDAYLAGIPEELKDPFQRLARLLNVQGDRISSM